MQPECAREIGSIRVAQIEGDLGDRFVAAFKPSGSLADACNAVSTPLWLPGLLCLIRLVPLTSYPITPMLTRSIGHLAAWRKMTARFPPHQVRVANRRTSQSDDTLG